MRDERPRLAVPLNVRRLSVRTRVLKMRRAKRAGIRHCRFCGFYRIVTCFFISFQSAARWLARFYRSRGSASRWGHYFRRHWGGAVLLYRHRGFSLPSSSWQGKRSFLCYLIRALPGDKILYRTPAKATVRMGAEASALQRAFFGSLVAFERFFCRPFRIAFSFHLPFYLARNAAFVVLISGYKLIAFITAVSNASYKSLRKEVIILVKA